MRGIRLLSSLVVGLGLSLLTLAAVGQAEIYLAPGAEVIAGELPLDEAGAAYEINRDAQGSLWITDIGAGEIWQLDPAGGVYTIYHGISDPVDARRSETGDIWWGDIAQGAIGQLPADRSSQADIR